MQVEFIKKNLMNLKLKFLSYTLQYIFILDIKMFKILWWIEPNGQTPKNAHPLLFLVKNLNKHRNDHVTKKSHKNVLF